MLTITINRINSYHRHHHYLHHVISHSGKSYYWSTNVVIIELVRPWVSYVWSISGWIDGITREVSNQFLLLQGEFLQPRTSETEISWHHSDTTLALWILWIRKPLSGIGNEPQEFVCAMALSCNVDGRQLVFSRLFLGVFDCWSNLQWSPNSRTCWFGLLTSIFSILAELI